MELSISEEKQFFYHHLDHLLKQFQNGDMPDYSIITRLNVAAKINENHITTQIYLNKYDKETSVLAHHVLFNAGSAKWGLF